MQHAVYLIPVFGISRLGQKLPGRWVWAAALMFRGTAWWGGPAFSDDTQRYLWEGRIQSEGHNPYATRPVDRGERGVPGADFRAVYGPLQLQVEGLAWRLGARDAAWMRLPGALADLAVVAAVRRLAPGGWLIYAWSPLAIAEFWGEGHNDSLALLFVVLAAVASPAGLWLGLAAAVKWWPLVLLPALARRRRDWVIAPLVVVCAGLPYASGLDLDNARFASGFLGGWRNNDSLYGALLWLTGDVYRAKYAAFVLLGVAVLAIWRWRGRREAKALATTVSLLAVSANVHPWYLTWALVWAARIEALPVLVWAALMPVAYETVIWYSVAGAWKQSDEIRLLVYVPVALVTGLRLWLQKKELTESGARIE